MARGFFAEINYQAQQSEKRRRQQQAAAYRAQAAAERQAEAARKAAVRARASAVRASVADQKAAQREADRLQVEAQLAEVDSLNADLANEYAEVDELLARTLEIDDYIDLESLKITTVEHPPFAPGGLAHPTPPLPPLVYPPEPAFLAPKSLGALAGKKKKQAALEQAQATHHDVVTRWQQHCHAMYTDFLAAQQRWQAWRRAGSNS